VSGCGERPPSNLPWRVLFVTRMWELSRPRPETTSANQFEQEFAADRGSLPWFSGCCACCPTSAG